ncbi:hypothetical protein WOLCODRAFT_135579 [Wolfiporia cocos MD-104 SS10]|uniref:BRCA2 OB1 domain-containing protein n=1 Tax=Wolfiporia cocos (strain MD-104) TaxID=742152 RepID=A0A2H3IW67_WOLCO|nr:hypothetical protein WOLCODRAFT_135579 [Wolfiporia cocos MD-104 SS10]
MSDSHSQFPPPESHRLSSPTYDRHFCLSQDELKAFDDFEVRLTQSQRPGSPDKLSQGLLSAEKKRRIDEIVSALDEQSQPEKEPSQRRKSSSPSRSSQGMRSAEKRKRIEEIEAALENGRDSDSTYDSRNGSSSQAAPSLPHSRQRRRVSLESETPAPELSLPMFKSAALLHHSIGFASAASLAHDADPSSTDSGNVLDSGSMFRTPVRSTGFGFASALTIAANAGDTRGDGLPSSSPDAPAEYDYSDWFTSTTIPGSASGFKSAKELAAEATGGLGELSSTNLPGFTSGRRLLDQIDHDEPSQGDGLLSHSEMPSVKAPVGLAGLDAPPEALLSLSLPGFTSARKISDDANTSLTSTPEAASGSAFPGFTSVRGLMPAAGDSDKGKAKARDWTMPSAAALARAAKTMQRWEQELEDDVDNVWGLEDSESAPEPTSSIQTPSRPALRSMENSFSAAEPDSPSPAGSGFLLSGTTGLKAGLPGKNKPFKSPLMGPPTSTNPRHGASPYVGSPLNPRRQSLSEHELPVAFPGFSHPTSSTSARPGGFSTPVKKLGVTPRKLGGGLAKTPAKFVTPFKPGMRPGDPGRTQLEKARAEHVQSAPSRSGTQVAAASKGKQRENYFNLAKPSGRLTLETCGLIPQSHDIDVLSSMGINVVELSGTTPDLARYYFFHSSSSDPLSATFSSTITSYGADAALLELHERGCHLATKEWVDNHWGLILWKLAGLVCLEPEREASPDTRRWSWNEVMRQLLYRYERELNGGSRPPLRLITTHDAPAACPMVLCVSQITWHPGELDDDGNETGRIPELELTDGWYRLRATFDGPLERAIHRGVIRVGRKIAVSNARLESERKEPAEVLEAYDSMTLRISGNSSHLVPWHARLGFVRYPSIATLDSLTPDGGIVTLLDLTVIKTYPIAFVEFIERDSERMTEGPRTEKDEALVQDEWIQRRERKTCQLQAEFDEKMRSYDRIVNKLQIRAGPGWMAFGDDYDPDATESRWEDLMEDPKLIDTRYRNIGPDSAGYLAMYIQDYIAKARERIGEDIQRDLEMEVPPRNVRNFRVVTVKDSQYRKREPQRTALLTIWDVLNVSLTEGSKPGHFVEGQRFQVTNVYPAKQGAWMGREAGDEVYLVTRRDSRFTRVKA